MKFGVTLETNAEGEYVASCLELGIASHGLSSTNALDALRENIRYHIEYCPCSTVEEGCIELDLLQG